MAQSDDCACDINSCNSNIFKEITSADVTMEEFENWKKEYGAQLGSFIQSYSDVGSHKKSLLSQAQRRLSSKISKTIITEFEKESNQDQYTVNRTIYDKTYEFTNHTLKNTEFITVKENDKKYSIHIYKCRYESCVERCELSKKLEDFYYDNRKDIIQSIIKEPSGEKVNELFEYLVEMYLYLHSFPYEKSSLLAKIEEQVSRHLTEDVMLYIKEHLTVNQPEITLAPYIYFNTDISLIVEDQEKLDYIDGFKLIAEHKNGKSSWENNRTTLEPFSNFKTSFSPGMILSATSKQKIDIYPDFLSIINQIENENKGLYTITNNAKKSLESFITSKPLFSITINSKEELSVKLKFENLNQSTINLLTDAIKESKNINICADAEDNCFVLLFKKDNSNSVMVNLITPDKRKNVSSKLYIKNNKVTNLSSSIRALNDKISLSNLSYNLCNKIDLYINGNQLKNSNSSYPISGNTNIELKYKNQTILDTNIIIYQDKDLIDFESLDIFSLTGKELCYNEKSIDYEVFIENQGDHSGALIYWNGKRQTYDNIPLTFRENSLLENSIKIKKNGYKNYSQKISSNLNYRGQYPVPISLSPINNIFGKSAFNGLNMTYLSNLIIPGKGQFQFYKTSNFNKFKSLIIGIGAYYFASQSLNSYAEYTNYKNEYDNYFNLYNNATNPDLINEYRDNLETNKQLMKNKENEASSSGLISGLLFLLNAIEITLIHISVEF
tara:strand:+ start:11959 stop:14136 length:2178 start_codon:yes stop_codon:yes gene_type:complete